MIADLNHLIGGDLAVSSIGDISTIVGVVRGQQRILRRLLTNPYDYDWHIDYGGGLASMIGTPADELVISGIVRGQISKEAAVSQTPAPTISVQATTGGVVSVNILYIDNDTGETQVLSLPNA